MGKVNEPPYNQLLLRSNQKNEKIFCKLKKTRKKIFGANKKMLTVGDGEHFLTNIFIEICRTDCAF